MTDYSNTQQFTTLQNRTIALAGLCQAVALVNRLATTGYLDKSEFQTCITSLLEQNPPSTLATYGSIRDLNCGFKNLTTILSEIKSDQQPCLRYLLGVLHLQSKVMKQKDVLEIIGSRLVQINAQAKHFEPTHENVIGNLADLYSDTISTFRFRIQVRGEASYLQQDRIANQVRSLLFSAIRSAILWHQLGGKRWHLLMQRKSIISCAENFQQQAKTEVLH